MTAGLAFGARLWVEVQPDFDAWREIARTALMEGVEPEGLDFHDVTVAGSVAMFGQEYAPGLGLVVNARPHVPKSFFEKAKVVAAHRDPERWNLLYRLLFRLQKDRNLMHVEVDADVSAFLRMAQQVNHDLHKMHAFVRFRRVEDELGEHFIAWYRPEHRVLGMAAPFFAERFGVMRWSILTPDASVAWDPAEKRLHFGPGVGKDAAPAEDELEGMWKTYYGNIFNPARMNPELMRSHMPVKYWEQLPEVSVLPTLMRTAAQRVEEMVQVQEGKPSAAPFVPTKHTTGAIREALPGCRGCDLYKCATQVVPGAGRVTAELMLVGEQPGDQEDLKGEPFVGPAGMMLRRALAELSVDPAQVFMTNAVKHFKFIDRGKRRLHQSPRLSEIMACRPWLLAEIDAIKPRVVLCLGASASKSLLGGTFALMRDRGKMMSSPYAEHVMATIHPSAILRARDQMTRDQLYHHLRDDLAAAIEYARRAA